MKRNIFKILLFGFFFLALVAATGVGGLHLYTSLKLYPQIVLSQNTFRQYEKLILADLKILEKFPLFKKIEFKNDAATFLKSKMSMENPQNRMVSKIFSEHPKWLTDKVDFKELTSAPEFAQLDPKWMDQLKAFDHWAWSRQSETQDLISKARQQSGIERIGILSSLPLPKFDHLHHWAAVYAIKKLQTKDLQAGLKIYRKVAELSHSSGTLVGQMQAVAMLKAEHKLLNDFQARDWQTLPISSIEAYKRLSWAWVHIVRQPFYSELKSEIMNYANPAFGACGGASENMAILFGVREFLEPQVSFETNFSQNYARAQQFQNALLAKCHLDDFTELVEFSSLAQNSWITDYNIFPMANLSMAETGKMGQFFQRLNWSRIPFIRKFIGLSLFSAATPETLSLYKDFAEEKR